MQVCPEWPGRPALLPHIAPGTAVAHHGGGELSPTGIANRPAGVARVRNRSLWRIPEEFLEAAQDDATLLAIMDMERCGLDIITYGSVRQSRSTGLYGWHSVNRN